MSRRLWAALDLQSFGAAAFVTCLGLGLFPKASGTVASFFAVGFWWLVSGEGMGWMVGGIVALTLLSVPAVRFYEKSNNVHDSSRVVIDEWIGMGIAMLGVGSDPWLATAAFVLFRIFDITKPPGVRYFDQNYLNGWGVILDDVVAGLYAWGILEGVKRWLL